MKKDSLFEYVDSYINAAILQGETIKKGDSRTANRQYTILKRIFAKAQKDTGVAEIFYKNLRNHSEPNVRLWACAHSLALGLNVPECEIILDDLAQDNQIGILSLNAEMTLKVWKKQGYLRF
jgi:hypothetical protein